MNAYKILNNITWLLLVLGLAVVYFQPAAPNNRILLVYLTCLQFYLVGISAFLVLKRVAFYRLGGKVDTIRLTAASSHRMSFIWQGILLSIVCLGIVYFYGELRSFSTLLILLVLFYYLSQVIQNGTPSIYINEKGLTFDDYFIDKWDWRKLQRIELSGGKLRLINREKDFELDFDMIDESDTRHITAELDSAVLDGELARANTSQALVEIVSHYAKKHQLQLVRQPGSQG